MVAMVSRRDSPFFTLLEATARERTSALSRFAAVSKLRRVRVDSSKKSEATTRPFSAGTFLMVRRLTSTKDSAMSRTSTIAALREVVQREEALAPDGVDHDAALVPIQTPSSVATMASSSDVGRFLPT